MFPMRTAVWCSLALHVGLFVAVVVGSGVPGKRLRMTPPLVTVRTEVAASPTATATIAEPPVCTEQVTEEVLAPALQEPAVAPSPVADAWPAAASPASSSVRHELAAAFALQRLRSPRAEAVVEPPLDMPAIDRAPAPATPVERVLVVEPGSDEPPRYPPAARRRGQEGTVLLRIRCDERGVVQAIDVVRSSGHRLLDQAAIDAVRQWRFRNGPGCIEQPVEFRIAAARPPS